MDQAACLPATAAFAELSLFISRFASVCWRFFSRFSFLLPSLPVSLPTTWRGGNKKKRPGRNAALRRRKRRRGAKVCGARGEALRGDSFRSFAFSLQSCGGAGGGSPCELIPFCTFPSGAEGGSVCARSRWSRRPCAAAQLRVEQCTCCRCNMQLNAGFPRAPRCCGASPSPGCTALHVPSSLCFR